MTQLLAAIGYSNWILHVLLLLPLIGAVPILLGPVAAAKRTALVVTVLEFLLSVGRWTPPPARCSSPPACRGFPPGASATPWASTASRSRWCCSPRCSCRCRCWEAGSTSPSGSADTTLSW